MATNHLKLGNIPVISQAITGLRQTWKRLRNIHPRDLVKPGVILAVLGASTILGLRANTQIVIMLLAAVAGFIAVTVLTRHLDWGVLAILPISFFVRYGIGTGTQTSINMTLVWIAVMAGVWLLRMFIFDRQVRLLPSTVNLPAIAFILAVTFSWLASSIRWLPNAGQGASAFAQLGGWMMYVFPVAIMLMVGNVFLTRAGLQRLIWLFLALGVFFLLVYLFLPYSIYARLMTGSGQNPVFYTWLSALAFGQFLFNRDQKIGPRTFFGLLALLTIVVLFIETRARVSNWLPGILAIWVMLWLRSWRWGLLLTLAAPVIVTLVAPDFFQTVWVEDNDYSVISRMATWPIMFELVKASPVFGLGPANYYHYTPLFNIMGYFVKFNSHNNYWDIAASTGLLGLGTFFWMALALVRRGGQLLRQNLSGFERGFVSGVLAGFLATLASGMLADWFMPFVYNIGFNGFRSAVYAWVFVGGLLALEQIRRIEGSRETQP